MKNPQQVKKKKNNNQKKTPTTEHVHIWQRRLEADVRQTNNDWGEDGDLNTQGLIN